MSATTAPSVQSVLDHHELLSNHGGDGAIDAKSVAFTLGFLAGVQHAKERSAPPLEALRRPAQTDVLFFDMDDCLYTNDWAVAKVISQNIRSYCTDVMKLGPNAGFELYKKYGTTLRGLLRDHKYSFDVADYMVKAHDISSVGHLIQPDPALSRMLARARVPIWVFTASTLAHAHNCLGRLDVLPFFGPRILACTSAEMGFCSKYEEASYNMARTAAGPSGLGSCSGGVGVQGELDPSRCYFCDDSRGNIEQAKKCGWNTCLIGHTTRDGKSNDGFEFADHVVDSVHQVAEVWPHLFRSDNGHAGETPAPAAQAAQ